MSRLGKLYKTNTLNSWMFVYVFAVRRVLPGVTIDRALELFVKDFDVDDPNIDSLKVTYNRLLKLYFEGDDEKI